MTRQSQKIILRAIVCIVVLIVALLLFNKSTPVVVAVSLLIFCCLCIIVFVCVRERYIKLSAPPPIYQKKATVVSKTEQDFFGKLVKVAPKFVVLQQVPLSSVVDKVSNNAFRNELFRVIDYCLVDSETYEPRLLIELNDASHKRDDRRLRDQKVKAICDDAGLNLISFDTTLQHDTKTMSKIIKKAIKK